MTRRPLAAGPVALLAAVALAGPLCHPAAADTGGFWRSLAVPGWGQRSAGHTTAAARFLAAEVLLWSSYAGAQQVARVRTRTYRTYAAGHAGAQTGGQGGAYFDDLGFYVSHHQHNQFAVVADGPQADLYPDAPAFAWTWDSEASRRRYRQLRNGAEGMERNALYATGLVVANHLVAAIHAARLAPARSSAGPGDGPLSASVQLGPHGPGLVISRRF